MTSLCRFVSSIFAALVPWTHGGAAQVDAVDDQLQGLRIELDFCLSAAAWLWPTESSLLEPFCGDPKPYSIEVEQLDPVAAFVSEHEPCFARKARVVELLADDVVESVVDVDIRSYFDNIPHDKLMERVREHIADGKVLGLIEAFLKQGVLEDGIVSDPVTGSPQGGIISPLLANITRLDTGEPRAAQRALRRRHRRPGDGR